MGTKNVRSKNSAASRGAPVRHAPRQGRTLNLPPEELAKLRAYTAAPGTVEILGLDDAEREAMIIFTLAGDPSINIPQSQRDRAGRTLRDAAERRRRSSDSATEARTAKTRRLRPEVEADLARMTCGKVVLKHQRRREKGEAGNWLSESNIRRIYRDWKRTGRA